jgi:hypothetical protein
MTPRAGLLALLLHVGAGCGAAAAPGDPAPPPARAEGLLTLEAEAGRTVRARFDATGMWTFVEVHVVEVAAAEAGKPARVRYSLRLSTEDGRTEGVAQRWSKETGWIIIAPEDVREVESGRSHHHFFACPYGTGWEIDATPEVIEGGRVRITVGGYWTPCTK